MFERFTNRAQDVLARASLEAQKYNCDVIEPEHILLGLVKGGGVGVTVLKKFDVDIEKLELEIKKHVKSGPHTVKKGRHPLSPGAKKIIENAFEEAKALNCDFVATEHILLGLLSDTEGTAARILVKIGLNLTDVRETVQNCPRTEMELPGGEDERKGVERRGKERTNQEID